MITINNILVDVKKFPNREMRLELPASIWEFEGSVYKVIWQFESNEDFFALNLLDDLIKRNNNKQVACLITSMPYERMDRSENGQHFSLDVAARMIPNDWGYMLVSTHSKESFERVSFYNKKRVAQTSVIVTLFTRVIATQSLENNLDEENTVVVLPDKGAYSRYDGMLKNFPFEVLYGEKQRDFDTGDIVGLVLKNKEEEIVTDLKNKTAYVLDDLSSYGGTFSRMADILDSLNVNKKNLVLEKVEDSIFKSGVINKYDLVCSTDLLTPIGLLPMGSNFITTDIKDNINDMFNVFIDEMGGNVE